MPSSKARVADQPPNDSSTELTTHQRFRLALIICAPVILLSVAAVIYMAVESPPQHLAQYRLLIGLLCFSLSAVGGILFYSRAIELRGGVGLFTIAVTGPTALWLISLLVFAKVFPEDRQYLHTPYTINSLGNLLDEVYRSEGWFPFTEWKSSIGDLSRLFQGEEESNIQLLLSAVHLGGEGRSKLAQPTVDTVFFFPPDDGECVKPAVKLQRIRGNVGSSGHPEIYVKSSATLKQGDVNTAFFVLRDNNSITPYPLDREASWVRVTSRPVDTLVVSRYCEHEYLEGDWIQVHFPKYLDSESGDASLGVLSSRPIIDEKVAFWEMQGPALTIERIPLLFRQVNGLERTRFDDPEVLEPFRDWISRLERFSGTSLGAEPPEELLLAQQLVQRVLPLLHQDPKDPRGVSSVAYPHSFFRQLSGVHRPFVLTFIWGTPESPTAKGPT